MNKLLLAALAVGGIYYFTNKKSESKPSPKKPNYNTELETKGFYFGCDDGDYIFMLKDQVKFAEYNKYIVNNLLVSDFKAINLLEFFEQYLSYTAPTCLDAFQSGKATKIQAVGFITLLKWVEFAILEILFDTEAAVKVMKDPNFVLSSPKEELQFQEASDHYLKFIEPVNNELIMTYGLTEEDLKKTHNYLLS